MKEKKRNLAASVTARLLNQARQSGSDYLQVENGLKMYDEEADEQRL